MGWNYQLVELEENKEKQLVLCEVYFKKAKEVFGVAMLNLKDIKNKTTQKLIEKDINSQLKHRAYFTYDKLKKKFVLKKL